MRRLRDGAKEHGLMPYAYWGGLAAAVGAAALFLYGGVLAGSVVVVVAMSLLWLVGVPLLLVPEVVHIRRVNRAIKDWNGFSQRIGGVAERRWEVLLVSLAALHPPPALAQRHAEALELLRERPRRDAGPAAAAAFSVRARTTMRALVKEAPGPAECRGRAGKTRADEALSGETAYARDLRRLWTNAEAASDRDYAQLEVHCGGFLRSIRRLKPTQPLRDDHARLIELSERYCSALKQLAAAMTTADAPGAQAAAGKLTSLRSEFTQLLEPWHERERLRWYGPE